MTSPKLPALITLGAAKKKDGDYHYVAGYSKAASLYVSRWLDRCPAESERINLNHTISCRP